jgi:DNA-directed RNA polymerase subunit RPC12/RpoP
MLGEKQRKTIEAKRRKDGLCLTCGAPRTTRLSQKYLNCELCNSIRDAELSRAIDEETGHTRPRAGIRPCSRCLKPFMSLDKPRITRCEPCRHWATVTEETFACEASRFEDNHLGMSHQFERKLKPGEKVNSAFYKKRAEERFAEESCTESLTRWTAEQVAAYYTPERIEQILESARLNFMANVHNPGLRQL